MTILRYLAFLFMTALSVHASAQQEWPKVYGPDENVTTMDLIETCDGGYIMAGFVKKSSGAIRTGLVIKTDVNGNILWKKTIGYESDNGVALGGIKQTFDGGYILFGNTYKFDFSNLILLKLNACGEKEWSKAYISEGQSQFPYNVIQMPDSTYLLQIAYWGNDLANKRIWLFKVGQNGDIISKKVQAQWALGTNAEEAYSLQHNSSGEYLLSGQYYQWEPGYDTNARWVRPMFIKVDSNGNEIWHTLWGVGEFFVGSASEATFNSKGLIYGVGTEDSDEEGGPDPSLFKLSADGAQLYQHDLVEAKGGGSTTISILEDSVLFIGTTILDWNDNVDLLMIKADTLGNIINRKDFLVDIENGAFERSIITSDNKLLATGSFYFGQQTDIYLWKFNRYLELDTAYTQQMEYDSLCPYQIVSDTISIDTTIVNLDELYDEITHMKVMPNPATNKLVVNLGEMQKGTELRIYNSSGIEVKRIMLTKQKIAYEINISYFLSGLYAVVLINKGSIVDRKKVVIMK